jgi:hypothetical protein
VATCEGSFFLWESSEEDNDNDYAFDRGDIKKPRYKILV